MSEIIQIDQNTPAWHRLRMGVKTASQSHDLMPNKTTGKRKASWETTMSRLIAEVCTGTYEELNAKALEWGKANEAAAIAGYEFEKGVKALKGGFIYGKGRRVGCSPDILVEGQKRGAEIKCPFNSENHITFLLEDKIRDEYITQMQFSMWVSGFDAWDFISFDPRMKKHMIKVVTLERDPKFMTLFDELIPEFIKEMDEKLARLGMHFGDQWRI
jgi:hypothetical protein